VGFLLGMALPVLVIGLFVLGMIELLAGRRGWGRRGTAMSSTGFDVLQEAFQPSKRHQVEEREHMTLMADQAEDGAPPRTRIDLERGTAHVVRPGPPTPGNA
jgi:hypothetical protein